jgi:hypothetical protein
MLRIAPERQVVDLRRGACHRARIRATRWLLAMTKKPLVASHPENREAEDEQDQEDHDEDIEQKAGDIG